MTREDFEAIFLSLYKEMCEYAKRRCGSDGIDIVQQAFVNALRRQTYRHAPPQHKKRWVYFKVEREIARHKEKSTNREQREKEGARRLYKLWR